jgi:hypothetical protein
VGRTILNLSAAVLVPRIPHRPIYMFEDLSVEGRQLSAVGIGRHAQRSDRRNPMAVEPPAQVTPRGPALKHELDLEHAHKLDRREVRRQNSGRQAIVRDRLERYAPMDGGVGKTLKEYQQMKYLKYCKSWLNRITGTIGIER